MPIVITGSASTLEKLSAEVLTGRASAGRRAEALRALTAANPGLSGKIPKGTPVVVPEVRNLRVDLSHVGAVTGTEKLADVTAVLEPLPLVVAEKLRHRKSEATAMLEELSKVGDLHLDRDHKRFLSKSRIETISRRVAEEVDAAEQLAKAFAEAAPRWQEELAYLRDVLNRTR